VAEAPAVSVLIPLYGEHVSRTTVPAVASAWLAQDLPCEVVIATAGHIPLRIASDGPDTGADVRARNERGGGIQSSTGAVRVVRASTDARAPGLLRNIAATAARAPVFYLSDGDVAPLGRDFLRRALHIAGGGRVVCQPWMHRLDPRGPRVDRPERYAPVAKGGGPEGLGGGEIKERVCFVTGDGETLRAMAGERLFWSGGDPVIVPPPALLPLLHPDDPYGAVLPFHAGGVLVDRATFDSVGGYCERYAGWGNEDDDLLVKLGGRTTVVRAWRELPTLVCLHFEHPRPYRNSDLERNDALLAIRTAAGPEAMISEDVDPAGSEATTASPQRRRPMVVSIEEVPGAAHQCAG
jgi:hypothetical protein